MTMKTTNHPGELDTTVSFLSERQLIIDLSPMPQSNAGYVWSRVFQRRKG